MQKYRRISRFIFVLLVIEFLDELIGGVHEAAWPLLRSDLNLTYAQVGLLLSLPGIFGNLIEPAIGILGDTWRRRALILGGGCVFVVSTMLAAVSNSFWPLLLAYTLFNPASGAFVSLSQATLMDLEPERHEQNMSRWTFAGSLGVVLGPLLVGLAATAGLSWRVPFWGVGILALIGLVISWRAFLQAPVIGQVVGETADSNVFHSLKQGIQQAGQALKRKEVLRWLLLLEFSDLMLDVFYSYIALYLVDVVGLSPAAAGLGVAVWTGVGLVSDFLVIPLLERVRGLDYLRVSAAVVLVLFPAFLLAPGLPLKLVMLALLGLFNAGWYSILKGQLYSAMPGKSGMVTTVGNVFGLFGKLIPLGIGLAAQQFGLGAAMWILLLGPIALTIGLPRNVD